MYTATDEKENWKEIAAFVIVFCFPTSTSLYIVGFGIIEEASLIVSPTLINLFRSFLATALLYSWYYAFAVRLHLWKVPELSNYETLSAEVLLAKLDCVFASEAALYILFHHLCMIWPFCILKVGLVSTFSLLFVLITLYARVYMGQYTVFL